MINKGLAIATIVMGSLYFSPSIIAAETDSKNLNPKAKAEADSSGWSASIADGLTPATMTEQQKTVVIQINEYLNRLTNLNGRFLQVNPDDGKQKGKFYIKRPGRIRFDYAPPSLQVIISDGDYLSIEDRDIDTVDRYPLENTPFRILLAKDVNILRDAIIKTVTETDEETSITMIDRKGKAIGQIQLFFNKVPEFELREWKVTDQSGQITRVILSHLDYEKKIDGKLFKLDVGQNKIFNPF
ncbi:MAG: outer-membrane lipoprotein carrier protein [Methyloligella sp.]|nr:MAG: outer-membrane lipoprotein carrier protein [Methyloligella sp.]